MDTIATLRTSHRALIQAYHNLPIMYWYVPGVYRTWTIKDMLAHLTALEYALVDVLNSLLTAVPTPTLDHLSADPAQFSHDAVKHYAQASIGDMIAAYNTAHTEVMQRLAQIPLPMRRMPGTVPWYGAEFSLDDVIIDLFHGTKRDHTARIVAFRERAMRRAPARTLA